MNMLDTLYKEYALLYEKLDKIADLIATYGGELPKRSKNTPAFSTSTDSSIEYPKGGSWKQKIFYALYNKEPLTAKEVYDIILDAGEDFEPLKLEKTIAQYLWSLAKNNEILIDKTGTRAKYSLKNKVSTQKDIETQNS